MKNRPTEPLLEIEEVLPILNEIAVFGGLDDKQLYTVFRLLEKTHFEKGDFIFERGDPPSHIYIVWAGRVELLLDLGGSYLAENIFTVGQCFGETAAIGIEPHTASAMAMVPTDLIVLPIKSLFAIWESDKALFGMLVLNIAREACRRLNKTEETLLHYFAEQ
jgi:CRP/FNR family cyclic AMP-dependent transcriptional regulator